jgi:hypothetical protein
MQRHHAECIFFKHPSYRTERRSRLFHFSRTDPGMFSVCRAGVLGHVNQEDLLAFLTSKSDSLFKNAFPIYCQNAHSRFEYLVSAPKDGRSEKIPYADNGWGCEVL